MAFSKEEASLLSNTGGQLSLAFGPKLTCADDTACQALRDWLAMPTGTLHLTLQHPAQPGTELVVTASSST